jgi:hypothetical protein
VGLVRGVIEMRRWVTKPRRLLEEGAAVERYLVELESTTGEYYNRVEELEMKER